MKLLSFFCLHSENMLVLILSVNFLIVLQPSQVKYETLYANQLQRLLCLFEVSAADFLTMNGKYLPFAAVSAFKFTNRVSDEMERKWKSVDSFASSSVNQSRRCFVKIFCLFCLSIDSRCEYTVLC